MRDVQKFRYQTPRAQPVSHCIASKIELTQKPGFFTKNRHFTSLSRNPVSFVSVRKSCKIYWLLRCLLLIVLCCFLVPKPSLANSFTSLQQQSLVTQEIRYQMAEAAQVFLVWGVNGWKIVPEEQQPPGTVLKDGVMYTPMTRLNDVFFTKVKVRPKTTIDYVFQVTQKRSRQLPAGTTLDNKFQINHPHRSTVEVWDAIGRQRYSYHSVVVQSGVVEVKALVQGEISPNPLDIGLQWRNLLLLLGFCAVFGIITKRIRFSQLALTLNLLRNETSKLVMFALVNRLFLLFIGYLFYVSYSNANAEYVAFNMDSLKQLGQVIKSFEYGDVGDYINIAQNGYEARPFSVDRQANWAFYPFYPIALKISSFFISNILVCGIVISNIFFLFSVVYLYKLISLDYNKNIAILTSTLMIIFPTSYFLSRPGPEALFILLVTSSLYYARKKQWLLSGILSALSVLTRLQGIFLFLPLIYLYYQQYRNSKEHNWGILSVLLMPVSLLAFMLHLYFLTGNFFASFAIQKAWNQDLSYPFRPILDYLLNHSLISYYGWDLTLISIIFMLLAVILTILMLKNKLITWDYKIYTFLSMLLIVSRNTSQASLRFMLPVFPLYLMLSLLIQNKKFAYNYIFFIFISLQVFYFLSFIYHYNWAAT